MKRRTCIALLAIGIIEAQAVFLAIRITEAQVKAQSVFPAYRRHKAAGGGGGNISLVTFVKCENAADGCTTAPITSPATVKLIVALDCVYTSVPSGNFAFVDNKNTGYTSLGTYTNTAGNEKCRLTYKANPVVGSGHTFAEPGPGSYGTVGALLFANADTAAPFIAGSDVGMSTTGSCSSITPCPPGAGGTSIAVGNVQVTFFEVPYGMSYTGILPNDLDYVIDGSINSGGTEGWTIAHLIAVAAGPRDPGWQPSTGSVSGMTAAAIFKHQ